MDKDISRLNQSHLEDQLILFLSLFKITVEYAFNSPLLLTDAWHSCVDILIKLDLLSSSCTSNSLSIVYLYARWRYYF